MSIKRGDREAGAVLVKWLNGKEAPAFRKRISALARDLAALCMSADKIRLRWPTDLSEVLDEIPLKDIYEQGLVRKFVVVNTGARTFDNAAHARVVKALRRYSFRPFINLVKIEKLRAFQIELAPTGWSPNVTAGKARKSFGQWPTPEDMFDFPRSEQEPWLVLLLVRLTSSGEIIRLRECECGCGRWLFAAKRLGKRFYDDSCRWKAHDKDRA
jgi:hypothetical protein